MNVTEALAANLNSLNVLAEMKLIGGGEFPNISADRLSEQDVTEVVAWMMSLGEVTFRDDRSSYAGYKENTYHLWAGVCPKNSFSVGMYVGFVYMGDVPKVVENVLRQVNGS